MEKKLTYLALGDSYTIGEGVSIQDSFPYQVIKTLRQKGHTITGAEIVAKTGWTTDELSKGLENYTLLAKYDFVTLLAGVNNQYRGLNIIEYTSEFKKLLEKSLTLVDNKKDHVIVLSIPDYSVTPFSSDKDREKISKDIDIYNTANRALATQYKVQYVDITESTREASTNLLLVAADGLHPSAIEYQKWADKLAVIFEKLLK